MDALIEHLSAAGLSKSEATRLSSEIRTALQQNPDRQEAWQVISKTLLDPGMPFELHRAVFNYVCEGWTGKGPAPAWIPDEKEIPQTNAYAFYSALGLTGYAALHAWSCSRSGEFWEQVVKTLGITFDKKYKAKRTSDDPEHPGWFFGARMNIAESCFNRNGNDLAITWQPEGGAPEQWSFGKLKAVSSRVANGLKDHGLEVGAAVAIDMVMTAEAVAVYLGTVMGGYVAVSIPDSLAPEEIRKRLEIADVQLVFTQDVLKRGGKELPLYRKILLAAPKAMVVIPAGDALKEPLRPEDREWQEFLSGNESFEPLMCAPDDPVNILFSSGTTGDPKAIPWDHTTPVKCGSDAYFHHDIHPGDVVAWPTNLGWMMGPWLIFAAFLNKASIALYYGAPTGREFGEFVRDAGVTMLGVVPSMVRQWKNSGCLDGIDWTGINNFSSTGESSNADDMFWLMAIAGYKPVIEYCGGTEIGGGYLSGSMLQPAAPSCFTTPCMGLDIHILDEAGNRTQQGEVFISGSSPGLSTRLLNQDHHNVYFAGAPDTLGMKLRRHGDEIEIAATGFYRAHGRVDDTMNLGGIKISSIEIERTLNKLEEVVETAAIAVSGESGGPSGLVVYAVLAAGVEDDQEPLRLKMQKAIREQLNPLFKIQDILTVACLPRTASNKVMRRVLRRQYLENGPL